MHIGIDIQTLLGPNRSGLYYQSLNLVRALGRLPGRNRYTGFFSGIPAKASIEHARAELPGVPLKHFQFPGWPYNLRLRLHAVSRVSLFQYVNSVTIPISMRRVNAFVIPDLTTVHFPHWHRDDIRGHWQQIIDLARASGDLILTTSVHTKRDVATTLGIDDEKICAIPLAAARVFQPVPYDEAAAAQMERWGLSWKRYILSVGTLEPRKNHALLLNAYRVLKDKGLTHDHALVFAGGKGWLFEPVLETIAKLGLEKDVKILGHADPLPLLYSGASMMVYPSFYEGFGLPPLEAMACGTPVIASNATSLPEVVGDTGLMIDPSDRDDLVDAMTRVLSDSTLQERMSRRGRARAATFSWEKTAAAVERAYEDVCGRGARG